MDYLVVLLLGYEGVAVHIVDLLLVLGPVKDDHRAHEVLLQPDLRVRVVGLAEDAALEVALVVRNAASGVVLRVRRVGGQGRGRVPVVTTISVHLLGGRLLILVDFVGGGSTTNPSFFLVHI